jgi:hypothetical protein
MTTRAMSIFLTIIQKTTKNIHNSAAEEIVKVSQVFVHFNMKLSSYSEPHPLAAVSKSSCIRAFNKS